MGDGGKGRAGGRKGQGVGERGGREGEIGGKGWKTEGGKGGGKFENFKTLLLLHQGGRASSPRSLF